VAILLGLAVGKIAIDYRRRRPTAKRTFVAQIDPQPAGLVFPVPGAKTGTDVSSTCSAMTVRLLGTPGFDPGHRRTRCFG